MAPLRCVTAAQNCNDCSPRQSRVDRFCLWFDHVILLQVIFHESWIMTRAVSREFLSRSFYTSSSYCQMNIQSLLNCFNIKSPSCGTLSVTFDHFPVWHMSQIPWWYFDPCTPNIIPQYFNQCNPVIWTSFNFRVEEHRTWHQPMRLESLKAESWLQGSTEPPFSYFLDYREAIWEQFAWCN